MESLKTLILCGRCYNNLLLFRGDKISRSAVTRLINIQQTNTL
jgi:hypothetical protein